MTNSGYTGEIPNTRHRVTGSNPVVLEYKVGDYLEGKDEPKLGQKNGKEFFGWYYKKNGNEYKFSFGARSSYLVDPDAGTSEYEDCDDYYLYNGQNYTLYPKWYT